MKQALSWTLSILFHAVVVLALFQTVDMAPIEPEKLLEVDLTQVEVPEQDIFAKLPPPMPAPAPEPAPAEPEAQLAPAPLPMDKTIVLDDTRPETPPPPMEPESAPEPEPDVVKISPVKTLPPEETRKDIIDVRKDFTVHRGHEARFGRAMMGDYFSYSSNEFSGQFRTKDDRVISIIDARNTKYGRFLIYDSKNKTLRRLKQALGKYVYTIGPSLYADEPVAGTVTFLAKNDRIERFILTTDDDRMAHYPRKIHVREDDVTFTGPAGELSGHTTLPPHGEGHDGVVFVYGNLCEDPGMVKSFTRDLSMHNMASIAFAPRGCSMEEASPTASFNDYADDIRAAALHFAGLSQMQNGKIGIWSNGLGLTAAIRVAGSNDRKPISFLICMLDDSTSSDRLPGQTELQSLKIPTLWLVTGKNTSAWKPFISRLEKLRDNNGKPFTIVVAPTKTGKEIDAAKGKQAGWVEHVAADHARLAESWIQSLPH